MCKSMDQGSNYDWTTIWSILPEKAQENLVNPSAKAIGDGVGGIFTWVFHKPIEYMAVEQAKVESLKHMTAEKLSKIPENKMDFSKSGLMVKALEDSKYSLDSEIMREYFSTLIAKAANKDTANKVSPYFSTILSNMSASDAHFLSKFKIKFESNEYVKGPDYIVNNDLPLCRMKLTGPHGEIAYTAENSTFADYNKDKLQAYTESLELLNSFRVLNYQYGIGKGHFRDDYEKMYNLLNVDEEQKGIDGKSQRIHYLTHAFTNAEAEYGYVELTSIGQSFANIVLL
ncbi:hypothetical protein FC31_GL001409 [Limosilactobacillus antri DSM 16041]|uniref:DUF4393 domain-containing protein n=2 Tax=Limosilactobacillus antri DSM 16041 TaxID=525309 RepID=A0ABR5NY84_9LACO|nr:hypothetical protein FC31_GL001409 [Limosilactobacillus antri DSM 16041]